MPGKKKNTPPLQRLILSRRPEVISRWLTLILRENQQRYNIVDLCVSNAPNQYFDYTSSISFLIHPQAHPIVSSFPSYPLPIGSTHVLHICLSIILADEREKKKSSEVHCLHTYRHAVKYTYTHTHIHYMHQLQDFMFSFFPLLLSLPFWRD